MISGARATTAEEQEIAALPGSLLHGRSLLRWWREKGETGEDLDPIDLFEPDLWGDGGHGFFAEVPREGRTIPVMGIVQEMFFDHLGEPPTERALEELREFVFRYFLRIADTPVPRPARSCSQEPVPWLRPLSWCGSEGPPQRGFTYVQHWSKMRGKEPTPFPELHRRDIVDLRRLREELDWVLAKVLIHDFNLSYRPFGNNAPNLQVPMVADTAVILVSDLVTDAEPDRDGVRAELGLGYFLLDQSREDSDGFLTYGPGRFGAGFQEIRFQLFDNGEIRVRLVFVLDRPRRITQLPTDPVELGWRLGDLMTFGMASRVAGARPESGGDRSGRWDPLLTWIRFANGLTDGEAAERLCISREQLERTMLLQHFRQHYLMIAGSLRAWRRVPNWLEAESVPQWVLGSEHTT